MEPKAIIVAGNGINSDAELAEAFRLAGAVPERVHLADLVAEPERILRARLLGFPGGFSYGDHLGSGQVLALLCRRALKAALMRFVDEGGLVIGICNGFQALAKMGMLPNRGPAEGREAWEREVSLIHNAEAHYVDKWVPVRFEAASRCVWTRGLEPRHLPIRHGEGRFVTRDAATLAALESGGFVALRYGFGAASGAASGAAPGAASGAAPGAASGAAPGAALSPDNPNGSEADIAGICDATGRVFGLMPHPEASLVPENHPDRRRPHHEPTGLDLFARGVAAARDAL